MTLDCLDRVKPKLRPRFLCLRSLQSAVQSAVSDAVASDAGDGFGSTGDFLDLLLRMCTKLPHGC